MPKPTDTKYPHKKTAVKILLLLLFCVPALCGFAKENLFVIAGSDFQAKTHEASAKNVAGILKKIREYKTFDTERILFCGDYTVQLRNLPKDSEDGISALKQTLFSAQLGIAPEELVLVQGNHDPAGTREIASGGAHDPAHNRYGVFVINEDDFMWMQGRRATDGNADISDDEAAVAKTAAKLDAYLKTKYESDFRAPVFVLSHLPLHYSMRTYNDGDGCFAKFIFDVLNRYGKLGMKLIFLYGHNHSNGWDNYLGGASVFLSPGEKIPVAVPADRKTCTRETLAFTYLNAGYTGYYSTTDPGDGADRTLSMTVFEIAPDGGVEIRRFSREGICPLKAPGVPNTRGNNQEQKLNLYGLAPGF